MADGIKVSVIVPVYNAVEYLEKCMLSLRMQSLEGIEIIAVNDASTDKSLRMLRKIQASEPDRIRLISLKENLGPGGARNIGLKEARGEYIGFVDSDDVIKPNMYEELYKKACEEDFDIVDGGFLDEKTDKCYFPRKDLFEGELDDEKKAGFIMSTGFIWSKIFKRSFMCENAMTFREGVTYEDIDFLCKAYCRAKRIGGVEQALYFYRFNQKSCSRNTDKTKLYYRIEECINALKDIEPVGEKTKLALEFVMVKMGADLLSGYFENDDFSLDNLKSFDDMMKKYLKNYYQKKYTMLDTESVKLRLIEEIDENIELSYERLLKIRKNGKFIG